MKQLHIKKNILSFLQPYRTVV